MADRFANGDKANDTGGLTGGREQTGYDPTDKGFYHGGDLDRSDEQARLHQGPWHHGDLADAGLQEPARAGHRRGRQRRLPRLLDHRLHPDRPAPRHQRRHEDSSIDAAHRKGMKVFFDIITNHTADVIDYQGGQHAYVDKTAKPYNDANGKAFDDKRLRRRRHVPGAGRGHVVPLHPGLPHRRRRDGQGAGLAQRPDDVPQPRRLHLRRRVHRVRRLLRARRPVDRAARGRSTA